MRMRKVETAKIPERISASTAAKSAKRAAKKAAQDAAKAARVAEKAEKAAQTVKVAKTAEVAEKTEEAAKAVSAAERFYSELDALKLKAQEIPHTLSTEEIRACEAVKLQMMGNFSDLGKETLSVKSVLKSRDLPVNGKIRYIPPDTWTPGQILPKQNCGYVDRFGNLWTKGPSRTTGQAFEWDVQLSRIGKAKMGWLSRDGSHLNVSLDGEITHL